MIIRIKTFLNVLKNNEFKFALAIVFLLLLIGTGAYHLIEGFSLFDSFYLSVITLTTIGYGDLYPTTQIGKLFTIFYIFIGIGLIFSFIRLISKIEIEEYKKISEKRNKKLEDKMSSKIKKK